jgi:hypothetical protein
VNKILAFLGLCVVASATFAVIPNPLIAPKPIANRMTEPKDGQPGLPDQQPNQGPAGPQARPILPNTYSGQQIGQSPLPNGQLASSGARAVDAIPDDVMTFEDRWYVTAAQANTAILRVREDVPTAAQKAPSMGYPGMPPTANPATSTAATSMSTAKSILVTDGGVVNYRSQTFQAAVKGGVVELTYKHTDGRLIVIFRGGVDVYSVKRVPQATKETPNTAYAASLMPTPTAAQTTTAVGNSTGATPGVNPTQMQ